MPYLPKSHKDVRVWSDGGWTTDSACCWVNTIKGPSLVVKPEERIIQAVDSGNPPSLLSLVAKWEATSGWEPITLKEFDIPLWKDAHLYLQIEQCPTYGVYKGYVEGHLSPSFYKHPTEPIVKVTSSIFFDDEETVVYAAMVHAFSEPL